MGNVVGLTITDYNIRLAFQYWSNQLGNILPSVLIVTVCVHDNVGSETEACIQAQKECLRQSFVLSVSHDVIDSDLFGNFHGSVRRSVINNQDLYLINPLNLAWNITHGLRQCFFFIKTWYLDD